MNNQDKFELPSTEESVHSQINERREFLKKAGKLAVTVPAVSLLVSASLTPTEAQAKMYTMEPPPWL